MIKVWSRKKIIEMGEQGYSARRIQQELQLPITVRQVQRIIAPYRRKVCPHCGGQL